MWKENGFESYLLLIGVGSCLGYIKGWLSWISVNLSETHLSFSVLTPLWGGCLVWNLSFFQHSLPKGVLCTQVLALTRQTRKGGREGRGALHTPLTSPLPKTWKDLVFSTAFSSLCDLNLIPAAWIPSSAHQKILKAERIRNKKVETQHFHRHVDLPMTFHVASFHLIANALCFSYNCSCAFRALLFWAPR